MNDTRKVLLAAALLVILAFMPGVIPGWGLFHSMAAMFAIGIGGAWLEGRGAS
jgi:hypothetical protein